jgi:predicted dienelactone hydrolase
MEVQTSQCEDLASQGFIVAAIDHTYVSWATLFPDGVVTAQEATTDFNTADPAEIITQIMAAINLDGIVFVTPKENTKDMAPFLMLANDKYHVQGIENREPLTKKLKI